MSIQSLLAELTKLRGEIRNHASTIKSFRTQNRKNLDLVAQEVKGSTRGHDREMSGALQRTDAQLERCLTALKRADEALIRVETI